MEDLEYLTPEQAAEKLQMNPRVVRRMLAAGKLPGRRVGRIWRISTQSLREFIEGTDEPAPTPSKRAEMPSPDAESTKAKKPASKKATRSIAAGGSKPAAAKGD